ncbi:hypothetical protein BB934_38370 (plasmid) [Microvirga ossetica]|uniref:Restriction endonuclease type IV Mrr domain-containing protein n=1 Tax=Microvirga ossetica TaxID=1882682 RepID=A0A1B2EVZ3_9HYPH|nr:restriction endonuclease [Microvirga ossetica]ANY84120.1 hypothetical protein BB934_38370 [Microvirga ossetica]
MLAERGGQRAVIRYKLYQSAVGNKAVQEAYAAMTHYSAEYAAVITSSGFTPSARRLSATTGVVLVLHSEVDRFDELLAAGGRARKPAPVEVSDTSERATLIATLLIGWEITNTRTRSSTMRGVMLASS